MAINALLGSSRTYDTYPSMPIGEEDRNIFNCPVCSRPLATGVRRCPGCRTRLIIGTPMARASVFTSVGLVVGLATGVVLGVAAMAGGGNAGGPGPTAPAIGVVPSDAPSVSLEPSPTVRPSLPAVPGTARSAIGQVGTLSDRLAGAGEDLQFELDQPVLDGVEVAETLRTMNSTAAFGVDVANRLGTWAAAEPLAEDLESFYEEIRRTARAGLAASVRNESAYRASAMEMLAVLDKLAPLLDEARSLARTIDVELPQG